MRKHEECTAIEPRPLDLLRSCQYSAIMQSVIEVQGLVKKFGDFTAVSGIDFQVEEGEFFGFLGPNGAGKTTTINILATLLKPTAGRVRLKQPSLDDVFLQLTGRAI